MKNYYYDAEAKVLIALDAEAGTLTVLDALPVSGTGKAYSDAELFPTKKYRKAKEGGVEKGAVPPKKPGTGCDECGSPSRHRKTCSKASKGTAPASPSQSSKVTPMIFGRVKISQSHDVPAKKIADNLDVPLEEVERVFVCQTYEEYKRF